MSGLHTLSVLVEDKPGVLARVASLFARRGFNIHSLAVGPTAEEGRSRMTVAVEIEELEQVKKQLHKLINVIKITEFEPETSVEKETIMVRVSVAAGKRGDVLELVGIFDATVVDVSPDSLMFSLTGTPRRVNDFLDLVRPFGIVDLVKSGRIALARESKTRKSNKH
jgi:acetolactate synthase-1/3 small subunit